MKVSIVLASYNGAAFIEEQLDSLRRQTRPADEVIIRDDCSTDATYSLCSAYIQRHSLSWRLLQAEKNGGYRENFRACIQQATGDWILLCDQDDLWEPDKLHRYIEILRAHPQAKAIVHSFSCIDANGVPIVLPKSKARKANHGLLPLRLKQGVVKLPLTENPHILLLQNIAMGCCMGFARSVCEQYLRLTSCGFPHDWELALYASLQGDICYTSEELIRYRLHGKNTIGLPSMQGQSGSKRPSEEGRWKVLDEFDALLSSAQRALSDLRKPPLSARYQSYNAARRTALAQKSVCKWIALHRYSDIYCRMFTWKQRLGDLYVILRRT